MSWLTVLGSYDGGLSLLAPLVAVFLAYITKRVLPSLMAAAVVAAFVATEGGAREAFLLAFDAVQASVFDINHLVVCAFSVAVAAMVGVMGRSGGTRAMVRSVQRVTRLTGRRGAMLASWASGGVVFFDDYANCLVVGSAMGPLCDENQVSREKLAFIVDATAAPIASLAIISTWVGYEVGLVGDATGDPAGAFALFLGALGYRFYCVLMIVFVGLNAFTGRDFGPMLAAEQRASTQPPPAAEASIANVSAWLGIVPIVGLVVTTAMGLWFSGYQAHADPANAALFELLAEASPFESMLVGSLVGLGLASVLALVSGSAPSDLAASAWSSMKAVSSALGVLFMAWTLATLIKATHADEFLASLLQNRVDAVWLPVLTFALASMTAFATGSSFFTMSALIPLVVPLALQLDPSGGVILLACTAAVLDGAVFGDHTSPISDTTILSSIGSNVGVAQHVRTQLPYALLVGATAMGASILCLQTGLHYAAVYVVGALVLAGVLFVIGRKPQPT